LVESAAVSQTPVTLPVLESMAGGADVLEALEEAIGRGVLGAAVPARHHPRPGR
jgi:hypothetical protein